MRLTAIICGLGVAGLIGVAAQAEGHADSGPRIYAYKSAENYCPEGLQPVTISGVICCGTPNQTVSYQQMLAHGAVKRRVSRSFDCPVGTKGCDYN